MGKLRLLTQANPPTSVLGSLIGIGAGLGIVVGLLLGDLVLGSCMALAWDPLVALMSRCRQPSPGSAAWWGQWGSRL